MSDLCRAMPTRLCPPSFGAGCGESPCARFESDDEELWEPWHNPRPTPPANVTAPVRKRNAGRWSDIITANTDDKWSPSYEEGVVGD